MQHQQLQVPPSRRSVVGGPKLKQQEMAVVKEAGPASVAALAGHPMPLGAEPGVAAAAEGAAHPNPAAARRHLTWMGTSTTCW